MTVRDEGLETTTLQAPAEPTRPVGLGLVGWLRWTWRQLTSMRTALLLLFLLAVVAVPGSLLPQRSTAPADVRAWIDAHPRAGPLLDRLSAFEVYTSPWFSAVYLLLFVSLVGCVVPRSVQHARALRARPPAAPRVLARLPVHRSYRTAAPPAAVLDAALSAVRAARFRAEPGSGSVAAEKGYLRETGNLVFHLALVGLLVGVGLGALYGTRGDVLVVEGDGFANTVTRYDTFSAGPLADPARIPPFSFTMTDFRAAYQRGGQQDGAPRSFEADLLVRESPEAAARPVRIAVNHPLEVAGTGTYLVGHGYAVRVTVRDGGGRVVLSGAVPFLPRDGRFTSDGVIKVPDARPAQLGFQGILLPTASVDPVLGPVSTFPAPDAPGLFLSVWKGDLGLDTGKAQSVYRLDTSRMERVDLRALAPGDTWSLPQGLGSITFDGVAEWAGFKVRRDPGQGLALGSVVAAIAALMLSLFVPRRRVWVRATPDGPGRTLVEVGGLARTETGGLDAEADALLARIQAAAPPFDTPPGERQRTEQSEEPA